MHCWKSLASRAVKTVAGDIIICVTVSSHELCVYAMIQTPSLVRLHHMIELFQWNSRFEVSNYIGTSYQINDI
jgi:hypothetical protein